jgi:AcrR family transcriptional regulator
MATLREKKTKLKKMEILERAAEVFRRKGFHTTTMDDIANQLMMTKGSLYYYFKSKDEILYLCHDHSLNLVIKLMQEVEASSDPPEIKLKKLLTNHMKVIMAEPTALIVATEFEPLKGEYRQKIFEKRDRFEAGLRQVLSEGIAKGVFCPYDHKILGFIILGALNWITKWYSPKGEMNSENLANIVSDVLIRAISKRELNSDTYLQSFEELGSELQKCLASLEKVKSLTFPNSSGLPPSMDRNME